MEVPLRFLRPSLADIQTSHLRMSVSTQRLLINLSLARPSLKKSPYLDLNTNSLKYLKLTPLSPTEVKVPITPKLPIEEKEKKKTVKDIVVNPKRRISRCAFFSKKGKIHGIEKEQNQDEVLVLPKINQVSYQFLFGVFDGHGNSGHLVSSLIKSRLKASISTLKQTTNLTDLTDFISYSIQMAVQSVENSNIEIKDSGSTLCVVLVSGNTLICANIGDSRCIIGTKSPTLIAEPLSNDHKPSNPKESSRILKFGGKISETNIYPEKEQILRVWSNNPKAPGLAMTRSIGDKYLKKVGVISQPEITSRVLTKEDKFLIIASDGIWDVLTNEEVIQIVGKELEGCHAKVACQVLVEEAAKRWLARGDCVDDISVVVVLLNSE